jgi:acyl-CoA synthetase (AMP-forming)/AMP-acid ligase II
VVLQDVTGNSDAVRQDILALCRSQLATHKIPALVNVVASIEVTAGGKVSRQHA